MTTTGSGLARKYPDCSLYDCSLLWTPTLRYQLLGLVHRQAQNLVQKTKKSLCLLPVKVRLRFSVEIFVYVSNFTNFGSANPCPKFPIKIFWFGSQENIFTAFSDIPYLIHIHIWCTTSPFLRSHTPRTESQSRSFFPKIKRGYFIDCEFFFEILNASCGMIYFSRFFFAKIYRILRKIY